VKNTAHSAIAKQSSHFTCQAHATYALCSRHHCTAPEHRSYITLAVIMKERCHVFQSIVLRSAALYLGVARGSHTTCSISTRPNACAWLHTVTCTETTHIVLCIQVNQHKRFARESILHMQRQQEAQQRRRVQTPLANHAPTHSDHRIQRHWHNSADKSTSKQAPTPIPIRHGSPEAGSQKHGIDQGCCKGRGRCQFKVQLHHLTTSHARKQPQ